MLKIKNLFKKFSAAEAGAVTVDWVVLTAAVVGLAGVVASTVSTGLGTAATNISNAID